jgi:hypothetical protein
MKQNNGTGRAMYGISRIDDERHRTHAWRVKLVRRGKQLVKNFPDKQWGGKRKALIQAKEYRDQIIKKYPPLTRKEFCTTLRSNNKSGISGVVTTKVAFPVFTVMPKASVSKTENSNAAGTGKRPGQSVTANRLTSTFPSTSTVRKKPASWPSAPGRGRLKSLMVTSGRHPEVRRLRPRRASLAVFEPFTF